MNKDNTINMCITVESLNIGKGFYKKVRVFSIFVS